MTDATAFDAGTPPAFRHRRHTRRRLAQLIRRTCAGLLSALMVMLLSALSVIGAPAHALLTIEITEGSEIGAPIAVVPFGGDADAANGVLLADIIESDLDRSGKFEPIARGDFPATPTAPDEVNYKNWRLLKAEMLVIGRIDAVADGRLEVRFRLLDVFRQKQLTGRKFLAQGEGLRKVGHQISDIIHEQLTGKSGAFDTRIAYITVESIGGEDNFSLKVADADGHNARTILASKQPILSPAWSPNGAELAYVSFEQNRSMIYVQDLWSGKRRAIAAHNGINGAPAWSPNGKQIALTLSKEGNAEIYIHQLSDGALRRLTRHTAIDTEPAWSPDGKWILFTSNRSGTPQLYRIKSRGGDARRITRVGNYNAAAHYSVDGKIALITNQGKGYRVGVYSADDFAATELTETWLDESPTFAPNGEMIMYATQLSGRNVLEVVSLDGKVRQIIRLKNGSVRDPAWSPINRQRNRQL